MDFGVIDIVLIISVFSIIPKWLAGAELLVSQHHFALHTSHQLTSDGGTLAEAALSHGF